MKKNIRLVALLLCIALFVCMTGCKESPAQTTGPTAEPTEATTPPPTTPPPPPADEVYNKARTSLDDAQDLVLDVTITTYTTVNGDEFSERSVHTLTYQGIGTDAFATDMDGKLYFSVHSEEDAQEEEEDNALAYRETYTGGTLYVRMEDVYTFCAAMESEEAAARYTPKVLLDAALYGQITAEEAPEGTKILFAQPSAAESWALPQEAVMTDASGAALLNADGVILQMDYTVTYEYGPAEIRLEVQSKPREEAAQVAAPERPEVYSTISDVDALYMSYRSLAMMVQADAISASSVESIFSEAAGFLRNQSTQAHLYGRKEQTQSKVETSIYAMDYSSNQSQEYEQEETYIDGRYTITTNGGLPTTKAGISWENIREYVSQILLTHSVSLDYWSDATITDMGSAYLLEYTLNENFGNTVQNGICNMLWEDPSFLYNLASSYETAEVNGYLSVDKYTGSVVAGGYYYKGIHTIEGREYALTMQYDQAVDAPALGTYKEITDQLLPEEEPENKATPLFYHVTGENGQQMWLLGTIHIGDARTAYLPQQIRDAFDASDALALECNTEAFEAQIEEDEKLQKKISEAYYYSGKTSLETLLDEEEYARALQFAKATGTYNMNLPHAKPYLWSNGIETFYRNQGQSLHGDWGVEARLMDWAEQTQKPIREIESSLFQIEMLTGYSDELQLLMLRDAMDTPAQEYWDSSRELYELWCAGDEAALREEISSQVDTSEMTQEELEEYEATKHLWEEYNKAMQYDRNEGMLKAAKEYLESGETVFYAVGLAHLLDDTNGLVDALRAAGYTVELVIYE